MRMIPSLMLAAVAMVGAVDVHAQRRPRRPATPREDSAESVAAAPTMSEFGAIVARLQSTNPDEVRESITLLTILGSAEGVAPLANLLRSGAPDVVTDAALEALQRLEFASSIDVLAEFTRHRRVGARRRAYNAIAAIEDPRVAHLLEQGLRDSDRTIREDAAQALGRIGARGSLDVLFRAFERGVLGAGESIGRLGTDADVTRFDAFLGRMPMSVMLGGYDRFLQRADISDPVKMNIVGRLREYSGQMACQSLLTFRQTLPPLGRREQPSELRRALSQALDQIAWDDGQTRCRSLDRAPSGGAR